MIQQIKKQYHWLVAVLVFLEMTVYGGLVNSASVFIQPMSQGLGVPTASYALALTPYTVTCFLGTSFSGYLFGKFGYKKTAVFSLFLVAVSLVLTACSQNLVLFCISKILFGMGYGACFTAGAVRIIKDWFHKHQGLVLGAVTMSSGLGGSLMTILLTKVIQSDGWRAANLTAAAIVAVIGILYLLLKDRPEQMGLTVYGIGEPLRKKQAALRDADWPGMPVKEVFRRPLFYLMCLCVLVSCVCIFTASTFMVPHFQAQGFTPEVSANYQSVYMLSLAAVKLLMGFLYDRFGAKPVLILCMLSAIVGQGMLAVTADPVLCYVAVVIFAVGLCMTSIVIPLVSVPLFGSKTSLSVNGVFLGLVSLAQLFSNPISSVCYDACGSYIPVFRVACLINLGILVLYLLLFPIAKRERSRM